jgi:hypothetical protein
MKLEKIDFDLLYIYFGMEYDGRMTQQIYDGLRELAAKCSAGNVPVRNFTGLPALTEIFRDCDYTCTSPDTVESIGDGDTARIMLIGGFCGHLSPGFCADALRGSGISHEDVLNFDEKDLLRRYVILGRGCVDGKAQTLYEDIKEEGREPVIFIDPKSSVMLGPFDPTSLYKVNGLIGDSKHPLTERVPRVL